MNEIKRKAKSKEQLAVVEIEIFLKMNTGEKVKVDLSKEDNKVFYSVLSNFYRKSIPICVD